MQRGKRTKNIVSAESNFHFSIHTAEGRLYVRSTGGVQFYPESEALH